MLKKKYTTDSSGVKYEVKKRKTWWCLVHSAAKVELGRLLISQLVAVRNSFALHWSIFSSEVEMFHMNVTYSPDRANTMKHCTCTNLHICLKSSQIMSKPGWDPARRIWGRLGDRPDRNHLPSMILLFLVSCAFKGEAHRQLPQPRYSYMWSVGFLGFFLVKTSCNVSFDDFNLMIGLLRFCVDFECTCMYCHTQQASSV